MIKSMPKKANKQIREMVGQYWRVLAGPIGSDEIKDDIPCYPVPNSGHFCISLKNNEIVFFKKVASFSDEKKQKPESYEVVNSYGEPVIVSHFNCEFFEPVNISLKRGR